MNKIVNATTLATITPIDMGDYYPYVWLKNNGDVDVYASAYSNMQGGSDNTVDLRAGEAVRIEAQGRYVYVQGATDIEAHGQDHADCPFESTGGGGSGGGSTKYIGTTTTALSNGSTTNPIMVNGESYTAQFGDIAVYNYTEFIFDGTRWGEFGRDFDTTPTSGSANAVTSNGIYELIHRGTGYESIVMGHGTYASADNSVAMGYDATASGVCSTAMGYNTTADGDYSVAMGNSTQTSGDYSTTMGYGTYAEENYSTAIGKFNKQRTGDLFNIGNGTSYEENARSNIVEVNSTSMNVNGDIQKNGISLGDLAFKNSASGSAVTNVVYDSANERFIITVGTVTVS